MKVKDIINQNIDIFKCMTDSEYVWYTTTMINFFSYETNKNKAKINYVRRINKKDEKQAKEYKKDNLLCATISSTFDKRRVSLKSKEKTGVICIDIDKQDNINFDADKAKQDIMRLPYVFMTMLSCRGDGIFCLVYYNKDNYIGYVFNALKEEFKKLGYVVDRKCGDITRLRAISYDTNILIKEEVERYDDFLYVEDAEYDCEGDWELTKQDIKDIVVCVYVLVHFHDYKADEYDDWLYEGFRLATIPNRKVGLKLFQMISMNSDNYEGPKDVEEKFDECCRTTKNKTNVLGYYLNKIKDIYGLDWRFRVSDLLKEKGINIV